MTTQPPDPDVEELPAVDTEGGADHPDEVTDAEAAAGHDMYLRVDDCDDASNGLDGPLHPNYGIALSSKYDPNRGGGERR